MKKKILFVRPTLGFGGADRVTLNLLKGFNRNSFECNLALMRAEGDFLEDVPKDVKIYSNNTTSLWKFWWPLFKILRKNKFDVLYSTSGGTSIPMLIAVKLSNYKGISVVSERNILFPPGTNKIKRRFMLLLKRILYKKADWVTTVSKGVSKQCHDRLKIPYCKLKVVNNPIINKDLEIQKRETIINPFFNKNRPVLLAVGRFVNQKDYPTLIKAFKVVRREINSSLFILGKGPLKEKIFKLVQENNLTEDVCFAGFDKNPFKYMYNTDVFILSSKHEGMPGALVQAMACEAVCITTDCPTGPNEIIIDGENGFLVPVGDYNALAKKVIEVLKDDSLRTLFKSNAREAVINYEEKAAIDSYFNFL